MLTRRIGTRCSDLGQAAGGESARGRAVGAACDPGALSGLRWNNVITAPWRAIGANPLRGVTLGARSPV